jgi:hypothetical protein
MNSLPLYKVNDRVRRKEEKERGAIIIQIIKNNDNSDSSNYIYLLKYDEGEIKGNNETGYWTENSIFLEK